MSSSGSILRRLAAIIICIAIITEADMSASVRWALVNMSVACVREKPAHSAELGSQVVMGTPVRVIDTTGGWCRVETPDGYSGYIIEHSLWPMEDDEMDRWRRSARVVVVSPDEVIGADPMTGDAVTDLVGGCLLEGLWSDAGVRVTMPDGRVAIVPDSCVMTAEQWAMQRLDTGRVLDYARSMNGRPYLWGGTSTKAMDCSGLTQMCYYVCAGVIIPRNASQQAKVGDMVDCRDAGLFEQGDLLLFGNARTGRVNHVAIYDDAGFYMHSSGRVKRNSIHPNSPAYLNLKLLHVRRIKDGYGKSDSIMRVCEHPWYFDGGKKQNN